MPESIARDIAMDRLERQSGRGILRYTGSAADLVSAGVIGGHMVIPPYSDTMLQMFCYGKPWSGRCDAPGVVQVIKTIDGDLAVLFFGAGKDVPSEMPPWSVTAVGNVVTLPWATSSAVKKVRRGRKVESAAGESTHALGCIRLVWSAPV